jgi:hypothetical protein
MAVCATLAIPAMTSVAVQAQYEKNQKLLGEIQDAVVGPFNRLQSGGTRLIAGFVADMGRVPQAVNDGTGALTLVELLQPSGNVGWGRRQVTLTSCPNCTNAFDLDSTVWVYSGWRGPYMRLLPGKTEIVDGWGRGLTAGLGTPSHLFKYMGPGHAAITAAGEPINGVMVYGANEMAGGGDYNEDIGVHFNPEDYAATISGTVTISGFANTSSTGRTDNPLYIRVYSPAGYSPAGTDGSKLRCDWISINLSTNLLSTSFTLTNLVQGPKVIRAVITNSAPFPAKRFSAALDVMLAPGNNDIPIRIDRPF